MLSGSVEELSLDDIVVEDRIRKDFGDIDALANSVREHGLIQPVVIARQGLNLIAGERRLRALRKLGIKTLIHASHFVWKEEVNQYQIKSMELEENLRRQNLSWQEEVLAKKKLLELQQQIYGTARAGYPSRSDTLGITSAGFGINKLAAMLGESNAQTSKDVELARLIEAVPELAKAETKEAARRQASLAILVAGALQTQAQNPPKTEQKWTLYEGDFIDNVNNVEPESVDFIITDPPYGEDAQGMGPNSKPLIATPFDDGLAATRDLYLQLAHAAWRTLRVNRFSAFFFGFAVYSDLVSALQSCGFSVDLTPLIWVKNTVINTTPYTRYGRSYEPILIARKGEPKLIRPSQRDVIEVQNVITRGTQEQKYYQAQKPVELIEKLILDMSPPESTVADFCAGSGTTGVAAIGVRRRVILFEKDIAACNIIRARLGAL